MPSTPPIRIPIIGDDRFTKKFKHITKNIMRVGRGLSSAGRSMTRNVTMPILLAGGAAAKVGADFDFMMRKVEAKVTITGKSIAELRTQAKELGKTTVHTAREVAGAQEKLAMAGWDSLQVFTALPGVLALSTATSTDLIQTADIMSNVMQQFGLDTTESGRVSDLFATIVSGTNVDMEMLAETMKMSGTVARDYGMSLEDTAAAAGFLGNMGIQGSMAGTTMARMMDSLIKPVGRAKKLLKKMGVEVIDPNTGKIKKLSETLGQLAGGMSKLGEGQRLKVVSEIFGIRGKRAASPLIRDAMALDSTFTRLSKTMGDLKPGNAQKMVDIMTGGATGAFKRFTSALEGVAISFAESGLLDTLADLAEEFTKLFQKISNLSPEMKKTIVQVAAIIAAVGPLLIVLGTLVTAAGTVIGVVGAAGMGGAMATFAAAGGPIALAVLAVGGLALAIDGIGKSSEPAQKVFYKDMPDALAFYRGELDKTKESQKGLFEKIDEWIIPKWNELVAPIDKQILKARKHSRRWRPKAGGGAERLEVIGQDIFGFDIPRMVQYSKKQYIDQMKLEELQKKSKIGKPKIASAEELWGSGGAEMSMMEEDFGNILEMEKAIDERYKSLESIFGLNNGEITSEIPVTIRREDKIEVEIKTPKGVMVDVKSSSGVNVKKTDTGDLIGDTL